MICFDPVVLDCLGRPEVVSHYILLLAIIRLLGWTPCPTLEYPEQICPVYSARPAPFTEVGLHPEDGEGRHCQAFPWPFLDPGDIAIARVHAVDHAGNTSEECSP